MTEQMMSFFFILVLVSLALSKPHGSDRQDHREKHSYETKLSPDPQAASASFNSTGCGVMRNLSETLNVFIVGGWVAPVDSIPWIVSVQVKKIHTCGGSIVKNKEGKTVVVTAAHCLESSKVKDISIVAGLHDLRKTESAQRINVDHVKIHPKWNPATIQNDIGVVFLKEEIKISHHASSICLPTKDILPGQICYVAGWGMLSEKGPIAKLLHVVNVPMRTDADCRSMLGKMFDPNSMTCAGYNQGGKDSCHSDSGGPLFCGDSETRTYNLTGIVSWGDGCAEPKHPSVYTRTFKYTDWIRSVIN